MAREQMVQIARRIIVKTLRNEIKWEKTIDKSEFVASIEDFSVTFVEQSRMQGLERYSIALRDENGELLDSIEVRSQDDMYEDIVKAFSIARDIALNIPKRLNDFMKKLDNN